MRVLALILIVVATYPAAAWADGVQSGGTAAPGRPEVSAARCATGQEWTCGRGQQLVLRGEQLRDVGRVLFLGARGANDDRATRPLVASAHRVVLTVPANARTGRLLLRSRIGDRATSPRKVRVVAAAAPSSSAGRAAGVGLIAGGMRYATFPHPAAPGASIDAVRLSDGQVVRSWPADRPGEVQWDGTVDGAVVPDGDYAFRLTGQQSAPFAVHDAIFPIQGKHTFGQDAANGFGGGGGHQGQDVFAACGTPLVAVRPAKVQTATFQSRAGNYVVLQSPDGQSYAYMHMRAAALVKKGDTVYAGQPVGYVGQTGRASGCHLHFELWTTPGWYSGGHTVDPLPELTRWDAFR